MKLNGFGPASEGSTMGLPGRWLVGEVQRNPGDIVATLTLVQPTKELKKDKSSGKLGEGSMTTARTGVRHRVG